MEAEISENIRCFKFPPCDTNTSYPSEIAQSITSTLKSTQLNVQSIIDIIIQYSKLNHFKIHIAEHITIPSSIIDTLIPDEYDSYKCIKINSISDKLSALFIEQPQFGDIILFNERYHGFIDFNCENVWISTQDRTAPNCVGQFVTIPSIITEQMPHDASYFYNLPFFLEYEYQSKINIEFQFNCIQLQSNDIWIRKQLKYQLNGLPSVNTKYEINLCSSSMTKSLGSLTVIPSIHKENQKTFHITNCDSALSATDQIRDYLKYADEPHIKFKVHGIPDYSSSNGQDNLPSTWKRRMLVMSSGIFRYEFSAAKSQIIKHFKNFSSFMDPMFAYWEDIHVVVGIAVIHKWGETNDGQWNNNAPELRRKFEQKINHDIFNVFGCDTWTVQYGGDSETKKKHNIPDEFGEWYCNIYYGPKCFVQETVNALNEFMNSMEHAHMKPWVELIKYEVQDPLAQVNGLSY